MPSALAHALAATAPTRRGVRRPLPAPLLRYLIVLILSCDSGDPTEPWVVSQLRLLDRLAPKRRVVNRPKVFGTFAKKQGDEAPVPVVAYEAETANRRALGAGLRQLTDEPRTDKQAAELRLGFVSRRRKRKQFEGEWVEDGPGTPHVYVAHPECMAVNPPELAAGAHDAIVSFVENFDLDAEQLAVAARLRAAGTRAAGEWRELLDQTGLGDRRTLRTALNALQAVEILTWTVASHPGGGRAEYVELRFADELAQAHSAVTEAGGAVASAHDDKPTEQARAAVEAVDVAAAERSAEGTHDQLVAEVAEQLDPEDIPFTWDECRIQEPTRQQLYEARIWETTSDGKRFVAQQAKQLLKAGAE